MISNDDLTVEELRDQIVEILYVKRRLGILITEATRVLADMTGNHESDESPGGTFSVTRVS